MKLLGDGPLEWAARDAYYLVDEFRAQRDTWPEGDAGTHV